MAEKKEKVHHIMSCEESKKLSFGDHLYRINAVSFAAVYLANSFLDSRILFYMNVILIIAILSKSIPLLPATNKIVICSLFGLGMIILIISKASLEIWAKAVMQGGGLVTLFICTSMISIPFFYEDYQGELISLVKSRIPSLITFCILVFLSTDIFGVLISIGAVTVIYDLMLPQAKIYKAEDEFLATVLCAFSASGFWSPAWASVVTVTALTGVSWLEIIPAGIALSLVFFALSILLLYLKVRKNPGKYSMLKPDRSIRVDWRKIITMLILAAALILMVVAADVAFGWNLIIIISLISVIYPVVCAFAQNHINEYRSGMKQFYNFYLDRIHGQVALFTAANFLGTALQNFGIDGIIQMLVPKSLTEYPALLCGAVMLLIITPSLIGIHPVVTGTAIASVVVPESIGISALAFSLTIITGWLLAILLSPFSATTLMGASYSGKPPQKVSLGLNGKLGFLSVAIFSIIIGMAA